MDKKYTYEYDSYNNMTKEYNYTGNGQMLTGGKIKEYNYW